MNTKLNPTIPEDSAEDYDELKISQVKTLEPFLEHDEVVYFSGKVKKVSKKMQFQERILLITSKAIYNLQPKGGFHTKVLFKMFPNFAIKKKIKTHNIEAITITTNPNSDQFIIHLKDSYDYRFDGEGNSQKIIKSLARSYFQSHINLLTLFIREEENLQAFHTTKKDFKAGINKRPTSEKILVSLEMVQIVLGKSAQNKIVQPSAYISSNIQETEQVQPNKPAPSEFTTATTHTKVENNYQPPPKVEYYNQPKTIGKGALGQLEESERWTQIPLVFSEKLPKDKLGK